MSTIFVLSMSLVGLHVYLMSYGHRCDASFVSYVVEYPIIYGSYTFINNVGSVIHVCVCVALGAIWSKDGGKYAAKLKN